MIDAICEFMRINDVLDAMIVGLLMQDSAVEMLPREKCQHGFGHVVVHDRIELISLQPAVGLMPDLRHYIRFRVDFSDTIPEFLPEGIIINFFCHVQAPAVHTQFDPVLGHVKKELTHGRRIDVELGQCRQIPPAAIANGCDAILMLEGSQLLRPRIRSPVFPSAEALGIKQKPIPLRGAVATFEHMMELPEAARGVVEHAIQNNADPFLVCLFEQFIECVIPT